MAGNNWVYLPGGKQWINLDCAVRVIERWDGDKELELTTTRTYYDTDYSPPRMFIEQNTLELCDEDAVIVEGVLRGRQ
jgi:hypothetical protein